MRRVCPECGGEGGEGKCPADGAVRAPVGTDAILGTTIGSWRVARLLGAGGMGRVYVAVQPKIGARVAIKILKRDSAGDPAIVERFFNEARSVNVIKHENIVDIIDLGTLPGGEPYIVMEYLEGASLGAILRKTKRIAIGTVGRLVGEVLAALEAAHAKGVIHRDLKPDNVFVSPSGRVTVLDFGIAKLVDDKSGSAPTQTGSLLGTPAYMSPEQARSQPLDARADLYSLGVILYEATTGTLPFTAANLFDLLQLHVSATPPPPRVANPEIPAELEAVILRALEKDPARRFASATEMRAALAAAVRGVPQLALASLAIPAAEVVGPVGAATQESLAHGETMPSAPPAPPAAAKAAAPVSVQLSRRLLIALVAGAALLGLGGAILAFKLAGSSERREEPPAPVGSAIAKVDPEPAAAAPVDAVVVEPVPEPVPEHVPEHHTDPGKEPRVVTAVPPAPKPDAAVAPIAPEAPGPDGPFRLAIPNPRAFDPFAYYPTAKAAAAKIGGKVYPVAMTWRRFNRAGLVDLTGEGSVEYHFISIDRAKAGGDGCYLMFMLDSRATQIEIGSPDKGTCNGNAIAPPHCTLAQLWTKAIAAGLPADAKVGTVNRLAPATWVFSSGSSESIFIDDDCP
jgi:serine/threonine-protein kinase